MPTLLHHRLNRAPGDPCGRWFRCSRRKRWPPSCMTTPPANTATASAGWLRGTEIPLAARITALTHVRPYKHAWSIDAFLAEEAKNSPCIAARVRTAAALQEVINRLSTEELLARR